MEDCIQSMVSSDVKNTTNATAVCDEIYFKNSSGLGDVWRMQVPPLIESNFPMALIYIILMVTALSLGTVGNFLIILVTICFKSMRKTGYIFIFNLAIADTCVASIADPMCVIAVLKGEAWFNNKPFLCETVAAMCLTACFCAFLSLTLATMNRYVFVCHNLVYDRIFTKKTCIAMCISAWSIAFLFESPNMLGLGRHSFDQKSHQCIWDRTANFTYTLIVSVGLIGGPLVTMGMCYVLIFKKIYSTKLNLYRIDSDDPSLMKKVWAEAIKSSRMLFIIFIIFIILWTPYAVVIAADVEDTMPVSLHLFVTMLAHLHSSVNFVVYLTCNRNFRRGVIRLLTCGARGELRSGITSSHSEGRHMKGGLSTGSTGQFATSSDRIVTPISSLDGSQG